MHGNDKGLQKVFGNDFRTAIDKITNVRLQTNPPWKLPSDEKTLEELYFLAFQVSIFSFLFVSYFIPLKKNKKQTKQQLQLPLGCR